MLLLIFIAPASLASGSFKIKINKQGATPFAKAGRTVLLVYRPFRTGTILLNAHSPIAYAKGIPLLSWNPSDANTQREGLILNFTSHA
jgi:hypothetical protein